MSSSAPSLQTTRKLAVVTGGSRGLGFSLAGSLLASGYRVILLARDRTRLDAAVRELSVAQYEATGKVEVTGEVCDVRDPEALRTVASKIGKQEQSIDFLAANAGTVCPGLLQDRELEETADEITSALVGTVLTVRAFLPIMESSSTILLISSGFGLMGAAGYAPYCAANAGILGFGEALRHEILSRDISVHVACPSDIDTPGHRQELKDLPSWMGKAGARGEALSADVAARKILTRCRRGRFLLLINGEVRALRIARRLLPDRLLYFLLDRMFPRPS